MPKVERVIDEVTIGPGIDLMQESNDVVITTRAKVSLAELSLPGFDPTRVKVVTEDGVVYLMGLVSPEEAEAAAEKIRYVPGVKRVVKLFEYPETYS
jgi:osmotically-inducible protein OsmY